MKHIALVGAGAIGSRHLQGLAKLSFETTVEVIDTSKQALTTAKERFEEIESSKKL